MSTAKLRYANQLEIIRSEEKDHYMIQQLTQQINELYTKLFGLSHFHIYEPYFHCLSEFLYYLTTTLANRQTIGEEYVCLIQYDQQRKKIPTIHRRFLMICFRIFGNLVTKYFLTSYIIQPMANEYFHPKLSSQTIELLSQFLITLIEKLHKIFFYLTGTSYHLSKTLTGIRYLIYTRSTSESLQFESKFQTTMKFLSICLSIQYLIESYRLLKQISISITQHRHQLDLLSQEENENEQTISTDDSISSKDIVRCPLCYELAISNVALVPECGHVFCWNCIHTWVIDNQTCPLCKTSTMQSRIVHLINY